MVLRFFIFLILWTFGSNSLLSQDLADTLVYRPQLALKWSVSSYFSNTPATQFGIEKRIAPHQAIQGELAYFNDLGAIRGHDFQGYKLVGQYRIYKHWKKGKKENRKQNRFLGVQAQLKQTFTKDFGTFRHIEDDYFENRDYRIVSTSVNILYIYGYIFPIKSKWATELTFGYGARFVNVRHKGIDDDLRLIERSSFFSPYLTRADNYLMPHFMVSMKLIYVLEW